MIKCKKRFAPSVCLVSLVVLCEAYSPSIAFAKPAASGAQLSLEQIARASKKREKQKVSEKTRELLAAYLGKGRGKGAGYPEAVGECLATNSAHPLCELIVPVRSGGTDRGVTAAKLSESSQLTPTQAAQVLEKGFSGDSSNVFATATESLGHRTARLFTNGEEYLRIVEKALSNARCSQLSAGFSTALAQRCEAFLPEKAGRSCAEKAFEWVTRCHDLSQSSAIKATYRYALLKLLWGEEKGADDLLSRISHLPEHEFSSRSLFWRIELQKRFGNPFLSSAFKQRLFELYPWSFSALQLRTKEGDFASLGERQMLEDEVAFGSEKVSELSVWLESLSVLFNEQSFGAVAKLSSRPEFSALLLKAEPEVQLGVAAILLASGFPLASYKWIGESVANDPSLWSEQVARGLFPMQYLPLIRDNVARVDPVFVASLIRQESAYRPNVRSPVGALGLMQLMPATARALDRRVRLSRVTDPKVNVRLGTEYLRRLLEKWNGEVELVLASYNAGPERVEEWLRRYPTPDRSLWVDLIPFAETRNYVGLIGRNFLWYGKLYPELRQASKEHSGPFSELRFAAPGERVSLAK